jgi:ribonuclease R
MIVTIDGADAKDLDDAVMIKKQDDKYILSVSIADVSYFVQKDSPLDEDAYKRGTSVYLVNTVVPMLPKEISNNLSSLNEDGVKLTITCDITMDKMGNFLNTNIYPSYIKSAGRLTYSEVNDLLKDNKPIPGRDKKINDMLLLGKELSVILRRKRIANDMIDFNLSEMKLKVDNDGNVIEIIEKNQDVAESLIEDFMVAANEAVAT